MGVYYPHGHPERYRRKLCRCVRCRAANATATRTRRRLIACGQWGGLQDVIATQRRIQAAYFSGWSSIQIADRMGRDASWLRQLSTKRRHVLAATADLVRDTCDDLYDVPGPSDQARRLARWRGWHPIEAWDDTTIGDPDAEPYAWCAEPYADPVVVRRALAGAMPWGQLNDAERADALRRLDAEHAGPGTVTRILRMSTETLDAWIRKHPDVLPPGSTIAQPTEGKSMPTTDVQTDPNAEAPPTRDIHTWFGLSYNNYLVLQRTLLQSMPDDWQHRFTGMLDEMRAAFSHVDTSTQFDVQPGEWKYADECTDEELKRIGATVHDGADDDTGPRRIYLWRGEEHEGSDYLFIPGDDPIPHYRRGREHIAPRQVSSAP